MRLRCLARAAARSVLRWRAHPSLWAASLYSAQGCGSEFVVLIRPFCPLAFCPSGAPRRARGAHGRRRSPHASKHGAESYDAAHKLGCAPKAQHASRRSAREGAQPHARNQNEPEDFGRPDRDLEVMSRPTRTDRTGACFPSARRDRPSGHQPSVRKRESQNRAPQAPRVPIPRVSQP